MSKLFRKRKKSPYLNNHNFKFDLGISSLATEWKSLFTVKNLQEDILAGIAVACISLPLALAIALASGVPPIVGLITAVLAGIVCALFGGSTFAISGPTPVMAVIVSAAVAKHGLSGLFYILLFSGLFQILAGVLSLGTVVRFVPLPVVAGYTAGIGSIIFFSQIPTAIGLPSTSHSHFMMVVTHIQSFLHQFSWPAAFLSSGALLITMALPKFSPRLPAPLIAVVSMTALSVLLDAPVERIGTIRRELSMPLLPNLSAEDLPAFISSGFIFFLFASLESLISTSAADKLKKIKKHDSNQELIGQGLGNTLSAFFGGIPVAAVITRTSLSIQSGAKTRRASIFHSLAILCTIFMLAPWIEQIPNPVLAGVLLSVALKMLNPQEFVSLWRVSQIEASVYLITFVLIVSIDLIAGIQAGILSALIILAVRSSQMGSHFHAPDHSGPYRFSIHGSTTFVTSGKINAIREKIQSLKPEQGIIVDMSRVMVMDASGAEQIVELVEAVHAHGSRVALQGLSQLQKAMLTASDPHGHTKNVFADSESEIHNIIQGERTNPIDRLVFGIKRFQNHSHPHYESLFRSLEKVQNPHTLFITCGDSRISPTLITSTDPGELFIVRNIGNIIPKFGGDDTPAEGAALEFSISVLKVTEIVICGHSECGAMKAVLADKPTPYPQLEKWLIDARKLKKRLPHDSTPDDASRFNTLVQIENLKTYPIIQEALKENKIRLHAWFYNILTSSIEEYDFAAKKFVPIGSARPETDGTTLSDLLKAS